MRWVYDVKKRKRILGISVFIILALSGLLIAKGLGNNSSTGTSAGNTLTPQPTVVVTTTPMESTPTALPTPTPAMPEVTPEVTPTPMDTPTPEITPTPMVTPTNKVTPTPTKKVTPTPTKKVTPTPTKKTTPTPAVKTQAPVIVNTPKAEVTKVVLKYKNGNANASTDSIYPVFMVVNNGTKSVKLSSVKIRYYYTKEDNKSETFWCDSFTRGATNVYGNLIPLRNKKSNADMYLEVGFSEGAGELKPGESVELKVGFAKNDWSDYNQKNDYSYSASRTYFEWNRVTLHLSGQLVFGREP